MKTTFAIINQVNAQWHVCHDRFDMRNERTEIDNQSTALVGDKSGI